MLDIYIAISCFIFSLLAAIYVSYSKDLSIIASIDHRKVKPEHKNKIAYLFSICLVLGTIFIMAGTLLYYTYHYFSILLILIGLAIVILFYIVFWKLNKWFRNINSFFKRWGV